MMAVEEGDILIQVEGRRGIVQKSPSITDRCIDNSKRDVLNLITFCLAMGNAADAVEIMAIGFIMAELDVSQIEKEFLSAAVFFGMFFGGIFCGFLSDKFGRRPCLLYSLALNTLAGIVSSFVPNVKWLICCRVIGGIGIGGSVPAVFSLGAEIFASSVRGQLLSVIASFWMMGAIFVGTAAWIMLGNDLQGNRITPYTNWRYFAVVCSLPALAAFFLTYFLVPESPRFLVGKLKFEQAALVLNRISEIEVSEEALKDEFYKNNAHLLSDEVTQKKKEIKMFNVPVMFIHQKLRKTTLTLMIIWFTLSFGSYGITTWISTLFVDIGETNPYEDSFIFALANLPGNLISILLVDKYGRKNLLFFGMFFSSLCSIGFVLGVKNKDLVVFCAALFNAFSVIGWNSLDCLSVEMFPTSARTSAMGFLAGSGRLGAISAQFVNGSLEKNVTSLLLVTSGCMIFGGVFALFLPHDKTGEALSDLIDERVEIYTKMRIPVESGIVMSPMQTPYISLPNPSSASSNSENL